ncbi:MAG TPA: lipopolysaccharide biosynthesis protein [Opitutaceae bacterium]|nr:lipopolysaccharide biosynthesis protein [Lacunisphaera sp.]HWA09186.1 lipopolysaccharide biosynthesis protein [Opitutaceae bacterium]
MTNPDSPAAGSLWKAMDALRGDMAYGVGVGMVSVVALIGNLVAARHLAPQEFGILQTLLLIPTYCSFLHLGVFNGLNRNIAFYSGQKNFERVELMVSTSWSVARGVAALGFVLSVGLAAYYAWAGYPRLYATGMIFVAAALVCEPLSQHLEIVYLSTRNFAGLGKRLAWQNLATFVGNLAPVVAGAAGFIVARVVYVGSRLAVRAWGVPVRPRGRGSVDEARDLMVTGVPLLLIGTLYSYLGAADRTIIACYMSPADLGHYALAGIAITAIQLVPFCIATVAYPRMASAYGSSGSARALRRFFWPLLGSTLLTVVAMASVLFVVLEPVVRTYLPAYQEGIGAAKMACVSSVAFVYISVANIIAVVRRNTPYLVAHLVALGIVWLLGRELIHAGYGITGVVWGRTAGMGGLCLFSLCYAYYLTSERYERKLRHARTR